MNDGQNTNDTTYVDSVVDSGGPMSLSTINDEALTGDKTKPVVDTGGPIAADPALLNSANTNPTLVHARTLHSNGSGTVVHSGGIDNAGAGLSAPASSDPSSNVIDMPVTEKNPSNEASGAPGVTIAQPPIDNGGAGLSSPTPPIVDSGGPVVATPTEIATATQNTPPATDGGGAVPGTPVAEPTSSTTDIGGTSLVATTTHTDEATGYAVYGVKASEEMPISAAYTAAGETEAEFLADNGEYNNGGTIQKGAYFEIRSGNIGNYDANIKGVLALDNSSSPLPGAVVVTAPVAAAPAPAPVPAPAAPAPAAPDPAIAAEAAVMGQLTTSATNTEADGRPALGMAPGSTLGDGTGVGTNAHVDAGSRALVYDETTATKINIPSNLNGDFNAGGYEVATSDFLSDNGEFNLGGKIQPGAHYEIRADKAFPGASTYDIK
jgi:hypothetical protein